MHVVARLASDPKQRVWRSSGGHGSHRCKIDVWDLRLIESTLGFKKTTSLFKGMGNRVKTLQYTAVGSWFFSTSLVQAAAGVKLLQSQRRSLWTSRIQLGTVAELKVVCRPGAMACCPWKNDGDGNLVI